MNKRTRLIVSLLFVVVIILAAAITRFYVNVPKDQGGNAGGEEIDAILSTDGFGYSIFSDGKGNCGIAEAGRIVAAPEWTALSFAGSDKCIAEKKLGGRTKYGCIDFEGNVVVPLIYKSIEKKSVGNISLYCAISDEDESSVLYNDDFMPYFGTPWKSCEFGSKDLTFSTDRGTYIYTPGSEGLLFKTAAVTGSIYDRSYELNIYSRVLLSNLTPPMIEEMTEITEKYIEYAFIGDETALDGMDLDIRDFKELFADSDEITAKRLISVPEIYVYAAGSEDGMPLYEVSVTASVQISYINDNGEPKILRDSLKAEVRFRGKSEGTLTALGGAFESESPNYPETEPTEQETESPA